MIDHEGLDIKFIGIPQSQHARLDRLARQSIPIASQQELASISLADLSPTEAKQLHDSEVAARDMLLFKMQNLGVAHSEQRLPQVRYAMDKSVDGKSRAGGYTPTKHNAIVFVDRNQGDVFDYALSTVHELSHASTSREIRLYSDFTKQDATMGMGIIGGNHQKLASGIENGLAIMDAINFLHSYAKEHFSEAYRQHEKWYESKDVASILGKIDTSIWPPITKEKAIPFISGYRIPPIRFAPITPVLNVGLLKNYLFVERLCKVIGKRIASAGEQPLSDEEYIRQGRQYLDINRYNRTNDAHRLIVEIFGGKDAGSIFKISDRNQNQNAIDEAMKIVAQKDSTT